MIGGTDIIIPVARETEALNLALRSLNRLWPDAVLEDAQTGEDLSQFEHIDFSGRREILAFRDKEAAESWEKLGADPSLAGTLVHFLLSPGQLTVVVDDEPSPQIKGYVASLRSSLKQDLKQLAPTTRKTFTT